MGSPGIIYLSSDDELDIVPVIDRVESKLIKVDKKITGEDLVKFREAFNCIKEYVYKVETKHIAHKIYCSFY